MRAKFINEFTRGGDPLSTLGIGIYSKLIYKFFDDLDIPRDYYTIEDNQIIFKYSLDLEGCDNLVKLPDNLTIQGYLYLNNCINLIKLPNGLKLKDSEDNYARLHLVNTQITELPDDLEVGEKIYVSNNQKKLIAFIKNSKFKNKLHYEYFS